MTGRAHTGTGSQRAGTNTVPDAREPDWFDGVVERVSDLGDGWVRMPRNDWFGVQDCWRMGVRLLREAMAERDVLVAERDEARGREQAEIRERIVWQIAAREAREQRDALWMDLEHDESLKAALAARDTATQALASARIIIRAADRLADAVEHRIDLGHWDARSEAGDALLDYRGLDDHRAAALVVVREAAQEAPAEQRKRFGGTYDSEGALRR